MKDIELVQEQMTHLANTIKECNFIAYEDKKDIVQTSVELIYKKFLEGRIVDDFKQIKGYCFITLRTCCSQFKMKKSPIYTDTDLSYVKDDSIEIDTEYKEYLRKIIRSYYYDKKMDSSLIELAEHIFDGKEFQDIKNEMDLTSIELGRKRQRLSLIIKNLHLKESKYYIKDINNPNYLISCKSVRDVSRHFPDETTRNVREKIYNKKQFKDGRYIETIS